MCCCGTTTGNKQRVPCQAEVSYTVKHSNVLQFSSALLQTQRSKRNQLHNKLQSTKNCRSSVVWDLTCTECGLVATEVLVHLLNTADRLPLSKAPKPTLLPGAFNRQISHSECTFIRPACICLYCRPVCDVINNKRLYNLNFPSRDR